MTLTPQAGDPGHLLRIIAEKELRWIEGTTRRWDGYVEFQRRPEPMLEWFEQYMS